MLSVKTFRYILVVVLLSYCFLAGDDRVVFAQSADDLKVKAYAERVSNDSFTIKTKTPKGARIYAVKKPNKELLRAIDKGLTDLFTLAKKNGYSAKTKHSDYTIYIARADQTDDGSGRYVPVVAVPSGQYKGTVYDAGGFIYAAGMVISNDSCAFLIAEHDKKFNQVSEFVSYEGEHLILYHNDRKRYRETADHSKGGSHPILN